MLRKIFKKIRGFELTLPKILGHSNDLSKINDGKEVVKREPKAFRVLDRTIGFFTNKSNDVHLFSLTKRPILVGITVLMLFFGVFGIWAVFAPIEGSVSASGQVVSSSSKKIIQHLEGGVIDEILVKEGDRVEAGELLIKLQNLSSQSQKNILEGNLYTLRVTEARLIAERDGDEEITLPKSNDSALLQVADAQERLFISRKRNVESQISILNARIEQSKKEIEGVKAQILSGEKQIKLVEEELENKKKLLAAGHIDRPRVIALERQIAVLTGKMSEDESTMARVEQQIGSTKLEIINVQNRFQNDVLNELKEVQSKISDIAEKLFVISDVFDRTEIKALQSGTVTNLQYHTVGGVISPGAQIMEIIPLNDDLVIEAKVSPTDIDAVLYAQNREENHITIDGISGSMAKVRLLALNSRKVGLLQGVLIHVSADTIVDNRNPAAMQYYLAQVRIPKSQLKTISNTKINLYPGMPVVVLIITEPRTLFSYLISPISSTFDRAFRER